MSKMNKCYVRFYGPVKEILRFMVNNMEFAKVYDEGVKFITGLDFSKTTKENDELFMKEQYGVDPYGNCLKMKVVVASTEYKDQYDDDGYYDYEDNPPKNVYEFRVENHGGFYDMYKVYERGVCFQNDFVAKPKEFMSDFFNYFSQANIIKREDHKKIQERMKLAASLEIEFFTYALPLEVLNIWAEQYKLIVRANWANEDEFLIYSKFPDDPEDMPEEQCIQRISADEKLQRYTEMLLMRKWIDCHALVIDICEMLYDMKDHFPVKIDLELKEVPEGETFNSKNPFKYNQTYGNISNMVYGLVNNDHDHFTVARMYASLARIHEKFMNENK